MKNLRDILILLATILLWLHLPVQAADVADLRTYYASADGKQGEALKTALHNIISGGTRLKYGSGAGKTWEGFYLTDRDTTDNTVIDMYSFAKRHYSTTSTNASVTNCDIEHMLPKSWWGSPQNDSDPAYCDLHHLVPADKPANISKSNWGPGVPDLTDPKAFDNGCFTTGPDATHGLTRCFSPSDEYKGDFARAYFYIATCYENSTWVADAVTAGMTNDSWQEFQPWLRDLLLEWHRLDPVSEKELTRTDIVYSIQGNRNPFIDFPCLVEYIWGNKSDQTVSLSNLTSPFGIDYYNVGCSCPSGPTITLPNMDIKCGMTRANRAKTTTIIVRGIYINDGNLTLTISGDNAALFTVSPSSITKAEAEAGKAVTITYTPTAVGQHTATLTVSGCGATAHGETLYGTCDTFYDATWMRGNVTYAVTDAATGTRPALPATPPDVSATNVFVGWTAHSSFSGKPDDLFIEEAPVLTQNKTFYAVYADMTPPSADYGVETYFFESNTWEADPKNWTNGQSGYRYVELQGVQVSNSSSGANATCPDSYNNICTVIVNYCTNGSSGNGSISIEINGTTKTNSVSHTSGGTTLRDTEFDFSGSPKTGTTKISVTTTAGSIYINSVTIIHGTPPVYSDYALYSSGVEEDITVTFMNGASLLYTRTGKTGQTITGVTDPSVCDEYTFEGWSSTEYATGNTSIPAIDYNGKFPNVNKTFYAVYTKTEAGSGSGGAAVNTPLWSENFTGFLHDSVPSGVRPHGGGCVVLNNGSVTYSCSDGTNTSANTKIYASGTMYAGGGTPEMMIVSKNGSFTITGIPTGNASLMTLTFKSNKSEFSVTSGTSNISVGALSSSNDTITCDISNVGNATFDLTITNTNTKTANARVDNFSLIVKTAAAGSGSTYHTTAPDCEECTPVAATGGFTNASVTTACDGVVSNPFTTNSDAVPAYSSSDETVATVNTAGEVTILKTGATTITAVVAATKCFTTGVIDTYTLTVNKSTPAATFVSPTTSITIGQSTTNTLTTPSDGAITYASDNTAVATVNASTGAVTALTTGTARITASVAATDCYNATSAYYDLTVNDYPKYSLTFMNNGAQFTKVTDYAGETVPSIGTPTLTSCPEYTFIGWSSSEWAQDNTIEPATGIPATFPSNNVTYYAVYRHVVGSGSVKDTTITETCAASSPFLNLTGWTTTVTEVYNSATYCGAAVPALKFNASDQYLQSATLSGPIIAVSYLYRPYNTSAEGTFDFYVSTNGTDFTKLPAETVSYSGTNAKTTKEITLDASDDYRAIKIVFTKTASNVGVDDISITYKKPSDSASTYYTTSPDCATCTVTITAVSEDDEKGTVDITVIP